MTTTAPEKAKDRGTMSQSKWRRLPKFSAAYGAEAKARAGQGFREAATTRSGTRSNAFALYPVSDEPPRPKNLRRRNPPGPKHAKPLGYGIEQMGPVVPRRPNNGLRGLLRQRIW